MNHLAGKVLSDGTTDLTDPIHWILSQLSDEDTAHKVSNFLLCNHSFDDLNHTPGEIDFFHTDPLQSVKTGTTVYWVALHPTEGDVLGVICVRENEHRTGGFQLDYIVVDHAYRHFGIATGLLQAMFSYVRAQRGRYILAHTCDLPHYDAIQRLFTKLGFTKVGYIPDYYFDGESRISYFKKIN